MLINENTIEQSCLQALQDLGWEYAYGVEINATGNLPWREKSAEVVFREQVAETVGRLNPQLPAMVADDVVTQVCRSYTGSLVERNQQFYHWLRYGVPVKYRVNGQEKSDFARLVDFQNVANNHFVAVNQLTIQGTKGHRRPDVIGFVNGLPLVVFELKNPLKEQADLPSAFQQLQTYKNEISDLFVYNQILVISDGVKTRVGSLTADFERFTPWRVVDEKAKQRVEFENELEGLVQGLMSPAVLLDYVQNFILFEQSGEKTIKKIAAYHQFYGVNEAVDCTLWAASKEGDGKIGVMWHTQGSGKSLSMLFYTAKVLAETELQNPTIVVVTDRNDLDGQLFGTFSSGKAMIRTTPVQADGRENLRAELACRESGGVIFTTIQKFGLQDGEQTHPMLNDRHNIIVISDEAHRSQYGFGQNLSLNSANQTAAYRVGYAKHLRDALPNASFIGFTGTPISFDDKDTQEVFGRYVSIYDINDAVEDGATVPIIYEARQIPLAESHQFGNVVQEVEALYGEDENRREFRLRERLMGTESRLQRLAEDFVNHFEKRTACVDGKAMFVAMSRQICVNLYNKIVALRSHWHSDDVNSGAIKIVMTGSASDPDDIQKHTYSTEDKKRLEKRFKDPSDPLKIVIVRDMWLTGFDAPCCHTMYIDKPMRGHNLMQAIARVNRVFRNKSRENGGLIVDYVGLTADLQEATEQYTRSQGKGQLTVDIQQVKAKMLDFLAIARGQLAEEVNGKRFNLAEILQEQDENRLFNGILQAANHILGLDNQKPELKRKQHFLQAVRNAKKGFSLCGAMADVQPYQKELAFFDGVRAILSKREPKKVNVDRQLQLVSLLNQAVQADGAVNLFELLNREQPNINILSDEFLQSVKGSQHKALWLDAISRYLKREISEKGASNLAVQKDFETRLKEAIIKYRNQNLTILEVLDEMLKMAKEFGERLQRGEQLGLNPTEMAFYDALMRNESAVQEMNDEMLRKLAKEVTDILRRSVTIDWQHKDAVRAKIRKLVQITLKKYKYPPDQEKAAIAFVIEQAEMIADELSIEGVNKR